MTSAVILSDNGVSSGSAGLKSQGGNDGTLQLQTTTAGGTATTAVTIGTDQSFAITAATGAVPFKASVNGVEAARIDSSGNLLVGTTTALANGVTISGTQGNNFWVSKASVTTAYNQLVFGNPNGNVGAIQTTNLSTAYNTSSDYRLKEDVQPMVDALAKVAALKPCTYKWKIDGSDGQGFIAHELAEVEPGCVSGEKDAIDANGNPQYQGIDTSFLVATLTAAIQELKAINDTQSQAINNLTERLSALEAK